MIDFHAIAERYALTAADWIEARPLVALWIAVAWTVFWWSV